MSHNRKLGKPTDQRIAMLRAMTTYLLENGQIKTTVSRAKEVAPMAEKMITLAKNANLARVVKIGPRRGDCAEMAIVQLV